MSQTDAPPFRAFVVQAVAIVGSQVLLAEKIGRSQQWVSALCKTAEAIPAEDALGIHYATRGEVPASSLRPDLWMSPDHVPPEAPLAPAHSSEMEVASS